MSATKIARRDVLAAALAMLGMSPARTYGLAGQRDNARPQVPAQAPAQTRWTAAAARELLRQQELAYANLGKRMGIEGGPMAAYRALTRERIPSEMIGPERFRKTFGDAGGAADAQIAEYQAKYGNVQPPTPYEDPTLYITLLEMSDSIEAFLKSENLTAPRLLLGTLPTGTTNAQTFPFSQAQQIIIFERGLFDFAFHMSKISASVFPSIDPRTGWFSTKVDVDAAVDAHPDLLDQVNRILHAYLVQGDPRTIPSYRLQNSQGITAMLLLRSLELFVLGHEYGHFVGSRTDSLGLNLPRDPSIRANWDKEYRADLLGLRVMHGVVGDVSLTFWAAVQFFVCMEVFDRCRSILTRGSFDDKVTSRTHPPNLARIQQLRAFIRGLRPGDETELAIELANELDSFWSRLWQVAEPYWIAKYKEGVRPSIIWT
jgi:hypothetical protein